MAKDYYKNRFVIDNSGNKPYFQRDIDNLYLEYTNLRQRLYHKYKHYFNKQADMEELQSYIDEQFVKLVKEYDITSNVDFPGYIKIKLEQRVKGVFRKNKMRDNDREFLTRKESIIEDLMNSTREDETQPKYTVEDNDFLDYLTYGVSLSEPEQYLMDTWLNSTRGKVSDKKLVNGLKQNYDLTSKEAQETIYTMRQFLKERINNYHEEG